MPATLSKESVIDKLCELAAEQAAVDRASVGIDTHLVADLNFDSLDHVEYVMMIEDEYSVHIPDEHASDANTIRQVAEALWPLLGDDRQGAIGTGV